MKRLTTDNPQNNMEIMLNYAYAEDKEVKLRYGEHEDQSLCEYIARRARALCGCEMSRDEIMDGACLDCEPDCALGILNTVAIQAAELRARLKAIEYILGDDCDLDRLRELVEADREGRCAEVVHCKDCIHYDDEDETCLKIYSDADCYPGAIHNRKPHDFCSYGKCK